MRHTLQTSSYYTIMTIIHLSTKRNKWFSRHQDAYAFNLENLNKMERAVKFLMIEAYNELERLIQNKPTFNFNATAYY